MLPDMIVPIISLALVAAGVALIAATVQGRDQLLARRIGMVQPQAALATASVGEEHDWEDVVRLPTVGITAGRSREITRRFSALSADPKRALMLFTATRLALAAGLSTLVLLWAGHVAVLAQSRLAMIGLAAMAGIGGWILPILVIDNGLRHRVKAVSSGLPDALELMVVCVEAGLSLEDGLDRVVHELRRSQPALADELALTTADLKILPSRDQALANFAERVDVPSVRSVITTLSQTLRYGTPLAQSLRVVASEMRNEYLLKLEERANRLPALLTLPVMLFIMPTIFLIVGGPAVLRLIDVFFNR